MRTFLLGLRHPYMETMDVDRVLQMAASIPRNDEMVEKKSMARPKTHGEKLKEEYRKHERDILNTLTSLVKISEQNREAPREKLNLEPFNSEEYVKRAEKRLQRRSQREPK